MSSCPCQSSDRHAFGIQTCVDVGVIEVSARTAARRRSATVTTWITTRPMSPPSWVSAAQTHLPLRFVKQPELPLRPATEAELIRN